MLHAAITTYLAENGPTAPSRTTLWEALKPTVRGSEISYCTREKLDTLEARQATLSSQLSANPCPLLRRNLILVQQELHQYLISEAKEIWQASQHRIYQWGDKSSKMLHRLCQADGPSGYPCY